MANLEVSDVKPFIGSADYKVSLEFYGALGCKVNFDDGSLAELEIGSHRFYLQDYFQEQWCHNSMLFLAVADAEAWYRHVQAILAARDLGAARVNAPVEENYGALVTYVWDPSGVLLHFAQWLR